MEYIDLGLPSGTKWADENEEGYYKYKEAVEKFGYALPTKEQFEELQDQCKWEWVSNGYKVTGPNGNSITLPAEGLRFRDYMYNVDIAGYLLSSTPSDSGLARCLFFDSLGVYMDEGGRDFCFSVRLVKNTKDNF